MMKNVLPSLMVLLHSQLWKVFFFLTLSCIFRLINSQLDKPAPLAILPIYSLRFVVIRNSLVMTAHWHVHFTTTTGHKTHSKLISSTPLTCPSCHSPLPSNLPAFTSCWSISPISSNTSHHFLFGFPY